MPITYIDSTPSSGSCLHSGVSSDPGLGLLSHVVPTGLGLFSITPFIFKAPGDAGSMQGIAGPTLLTIWKISYLKWIIQLFLGQDFLQSTFLSRMDLYSNYTSLYQQQLASFTVVWSRVETWGTLLMSVWQQAHWPNVTQPICSLFHCSVKRINSCYLVFTHSLTVYL